MTICSSILQHTRVSATGGGWGGLAVLEFPFLQTGATKAIFSTLMAVKQNPVRYLKESGQLPPRVVSGLCGSGDFWGLIFAGSFTKKFMKH